MDGFFNLARRTSLVGVAAAALFGLASCNEAPSAPPPPPAAAYQPPPPPPALLGAPPPPREFVSMAPIANPEDMSPAERLKVYGARYPIHHRGDRSPGWWLRAHGWKAGHLAQPVATAPAPKVMAPPPPKPVVAAPPSPIAQLAAAVTAKSKGAVLAVPADLSAAKPGAVTLSLPADLLLAIRQEAVKLGLAKAARKTDVTATLNGDGYKITPEGPQTATLVPGKPAVFTWQVAPGPNAKGPLTADVGALLRGAGDVKSFSLAKLQQAVAAVDAAAQKAEAAGRGFKFPSLNMFSIPGHKTVTLPVVGKTPSKSVVGLLVALLVLAILVMAARGAAGRRQATERRRFRTMAGTAAPVSLLDAEPEPQAAPVLATAPPHDTPAYDPADYAPATEAHLAPAEDEAPAATEHPVVEPVTGDHHATVVEDAHHAEVSAPVVDDHAVVDAVHDQPVVTEAHAVETAEPVAQDVVAHAEPEAEPYAFSPIGDGRPNLAPAVDAHDVVADDDHAVEAVHHDEPAPPPHAPDYPVSVEAAHPHPSNHLVLESV